MGKFAGPGTAGPGTAGPGLSLNKNSNWPRKFPANQLFLLQIQPGSIIQDHKVDRKLQMFT